MKKILILLLLLLDLRAYELLKLFENTFHAECVNYSNGKVFIASKDELFIVDLTLKKVIAKTTYDGQILALKGGEPIIEGNLDFNLKFGRISSSNSYQNSEILLFQKGDEILALKSNKDRILKSITRVKMITSFATNSEILASFFDRNLTKFDENLTYISSKKTPNLTTAILVDRDGVYLGDNEGYIMHKTSSIKVGSQIDSLAYCGGKICAGDFNGNIYMFDKNLSKEEYKEQIFFDRVRGLFYDSNVGIIAISWTGDIAILDKFKEF